MFLGFSIFNFCSCPDYEVKLNSGYYLGLCLYGFEKKITLLDLGDRIILMAVKPIGFCLVSALANF